jgi:hypothetical protein
VEFKRILNQQLPTGTSEIEAAVRAFIEETKPPCDPQGFFIQTMSTIYDCVYRNGGDFWLAVDESNRVAAYAIGSVSKGSDGALCYWLTQAYIAPEHRSLKRARSYWHTLRDQGKKYFCKHVLVVSGRTGQEKAYMRFLGPKVYQDTVVLKEDI